MANKPFGILSPTSGIKQDYPSILLKDAYMPDESDDIDNVWFKDGEIHSIRKRVKEFTQQLDDPILYSEQYWKKDETFKLMAATKRDIVYRDAANDRYVFVTPQYSTGVLRVENGSAEVYGGLNLDDCDDDGVAWADGSGGDVTVSRETTEKKENTASVKMIVDAAAGVELLAYHDIAAVNLSTYDAIGFWFYSSVALAAGDLKFYMDDTAGCGSPIETIDLPEIAATTWTWVEIDMDDPSLCTAIVSLGIYQAVDKGAMTLYIDQIVAGDWEGQLNANDFITIGTTYSTDDTWYEVSAVTDTHITLTAVYAGSTAYQQAYLARQTYTGGNTDFWKSVTFNDNWLVTNGVDNIQTYDGSGQAADLSGSPPKAREITVYENYVIVGNIQPGEPYTYQWCAIGDETNWSTGDSGSNEIDDYFLIKGFAKNSGFLIILTERTLERVWLVGGDLVFNKKRITSDCGAWASRSIIETNSAIYFYAPDNTFRKFTGLTWESISRPFDKYIKDIHPAYEKSITVTYIEEHDVILWAVPDSTSTGRLNQVLCYDLKKPIGVDSWSKFAMEVMAFGFYEVEDTETWDTWSFATWDSITWDRWDTRTGFEGAPRELCTDYSGDTFRLFASETDNGDSFTRKFVLSTSLSKNKSSLQYVKRLIKARLIFRNEEAGTVNVYIKRDFEGSYQSAGSVSLDGSEDFLFLDVYMNYSGKNFIFKFEATNRFRFIGMIFDEESFSIEGNR